MQKLFSRYQKALRYLVAGVFVAVIEYGLFLVLHYSWSVEIWLAQTISFLTGLVVAFLVHALWTFKGEVAMEHKKHRFILYCLLAGINVVVTGLLITVLQRLGVSAWIAKVFVMGAVVVWNFALLNRIIFSPHLTNFLTLATLKRHIDTTLLFIAVSAIGIAFAIIVPLGAGHDEIAHVIKADAATRLDVLPREHQFIDADGKQATIYTHRVSRNLWDFAAHAFNTRNNEITNELHYILQEKKSQPYNGEIIAVDAWGAAGYNSIAYAPQAIGFKMAKMAQTDVATAMYSARVSAAIFCAAVVAIAYGLMHRYRSRLIIALAALFPPIVASFAAISADGFINAGAILLAAIILKSTLDKRPVGIGLRIIALLVAIALPLVKLPYVALSLLVGVSPVFYRGKRGGIIIAAVLLTILLSSIGWTKLMHSPNELQSKRVSCCQGPASSGDQVKYTLSHPVEVTRSAIVSISREHLFENTGRITHHNPREKLLDGDLLLLYALLFPLAATLYAAEIRGAWRRHKTTYRAIVIAVLLTISLIIMALYAASNSVGQSYIWGLQARYFLPLAAFVLVLLARVLTWIDVVRQPQIVSKYLVLSAVVIDIITAISYIDTLAN